MTRANLNSTTPTAAAFRWLATSIVASSALLAALGCSQRQPAQAPRAKTHGEEQQAIVEKAATAVTRMRQNTRFADMDAYISRAQAIMIFPRVIKASVLFGGEGGSGVLVSRGPDNSWSDPAFYSVGAPSIGLQAGYQEATVILFIMDRKTLDRALDTSLTLGASSGATLGMVGERDNTAGSVDKANVYQMVEAGGVYAGLSLQGYVIGARGNHNLEYYGRSLTPREIVVDRLVQRPDANVLRSSLSSPQAPNVKRPLPAAQVVD